MPRVKLAGTKYADADMVKLLDGTRRYHGMSVEEICLRTGMSKSTYQRRMSAPGEITIAELRKLAGALRLDPIAMERLQSYVFSEVRNA